MGSICKRPAITSLGLNKYFSIIGADAKAKDNDVLDELTKSAKSLIGDIDDPTLRDAAIVESGNKVEHYEIAVYGSLALFAKQLGFQDATHLLQQTLEEEKPRCQADPTR